MIRGRPVLDHMVWGVPELASGTARIASALGVEPVPGGRHLGRGTANTLVGLGDGSFFEIIGPDPQLPEADPDAVFGVGRLSAPILLTWAVRTTDIDAAVARSRAHGWDPGEPAAMSRTRPDGTVLRWRLTPDTIRRTGGVVPFLIDWGDTPPPGQAELPRVESSGFALRHPQPDLVGAALDALGLEAASAPVVPVASGALGPAGLSITLHGPGGAITLD